MSTQAQLDQPMGEWLATADVGARYGVLVETVRYWRHISYGPVPIKLGRHVRYLADRLGRLHNSTEGRRGRAPDSLPPSCERAARPCRPSPNREAPTGPRTD